MAEEEINYSSVVFKTKTQSRPEAQKEEETVYDEVKGPQKTAEKAADINVSAGLLPDKKATDRHPHCLLLTCLGIFSFILLFGIITVSVYLSMYKHESEAVKQLKDNNTAQLVIIQNLTEENENLKRENNNLTVLIGNLTQNYTVLESKISDLTVKNQNLTVENKQLETQNQELETQKNNLTEQLQKAKWNENSVAQAQKIINAYCPRESQNRECKSCENGWENSQSRCYAINNPKKPDLKTWEKAQENCRGKFSDLAAIVDEDEKKFISDHSYYDAQIKGYWIGLRVEDGRWKWIDGRNLNDSFWTQPPTKGHCAISVHNKGWESVNCGDNNGWICEKEAVSL